MKKQEQKLIVFKIYDYNVTVKDPNMKGDIIGGLGLRVMTNYGIKRFSFSLKNDQIKLQISRKEIDKMNPKHLRLLMNEAKKIFKLALKNKLLNELQLNKFNKIYLN